MVAYRQVTSAYCSGQRVCRMSVDLGGDEASSISKQLALNIRAVLAFDLRFECAFCWN